MSHTMTCPEYEALLDRDLEGELSLDERARADAHLASCPRCAALRADLLEIAAKAAALPVESPSRDLWDGIAARIEAPVISLGTTGEHRVGHRPHFLRYAAAAAALIVVTAGTTHVLTRNVLLGDDSRAIAAREATVGEPDTAVVGAAQLVSDPQTIAADAAFDREVTRLRALLEERRPDLDSATVALLERNLDVIDRAIEESRAALAMNPGSALLNRQLQSALGKKVQVLRTAALLPRGAD